MQTVAPTPEGFTAALSDRLTESYHPLLELCRLLTESLACGATAGTSLRPSFLIDMERVFERYVTQGVVAAFRRCGPFDVSVQPLYRANQPVAGQPDIQLRPDVVIHGDGRPLLVVDAKWKRLLGSPLVTPDLYQVLAYCTTLPVRRALLVYPGRRDRVWHYRARQGFRSAGDPHAAGRRLARGVWAFLASLGTGGAPGSAGRAGGVSPRMSARHHIRGLTPLGSPFVQKQ